MRHLETWVRITLVNLAIVAILGLTLRSKMLFSIPFLDFKHILHAHSHFAFGGWVTISLLAIMTYRLLPVQLYNKAVYKWLLAGFLLNAYGMLFSFPFQGYGFLSILFSTLFIFVSYIFTVVFIKDILRANVAQPVKILSIGALAYMTLSSVGPFTLAYLLAAKSQNVFLYKDSIYTYLHLQYSGFFTLAVFALMTHYLQTEHKHVKTFAWLLIASVLPSMCISYLWHYPGTVIRVIAVIGTVLIVLSTVWFIAMSAVMRPAFHTLKPVAKKIAGIAMTAFLFKMIFQACTIFPSLGSLVFTNRPVIIGFLHLVLLGFVSLFILAYYVEAGLLPYKKMAGAALWIFIAGIIINEIVLFAQGLGVILMMSSALINWLLLGAAACLFTGALLMAFGKLSFRNPFQLKSYSYLKNVKSFSQS